MLTRKENENIFIGKDIEVTITRVSGDKVRVSVAAPRHISVYRKEVGLLLGLGYKQVDVQPGVVEFALPAAHHCPGWWP